MHPMHHTCERLVQACVYSHRFLAHVPSVVMAAGDELNAHRVLARLIKNDPRVDEHNPDHQAAFHACRLSCRRVTPEAFWKLLNSKKTTTEQRQTHTLSYYLVDKRLAQIEDHPAPDQPSQVLAAAVKTKVDLDELGAVGTDQVDWDNFYVIDKSVRRPLDCSEISFTAGRVHRYSQDEQPKAPSAVPITPSAAAGSQAVQQYPVGSRQVKRRASAESNDIDEVEAKRPKDLMKQLIENMQEAASMNRWYSADPCQSSTVHFWAKECVSAVTNGSDTNGGDTACIGELPPGQKKTLAGFGKFLARAPLDKGDFEACYTLFI